MTGRGGDFDEHTEPTPGERRALSAEGAAVKDSLTPDVAAIRARAEAATPGPWRAEHRHVACTDAPEAHRYIGSTSDPSARFTSHLSDRARPQVQAWVQSVRDSGNVVEMLRLWEGVGRAEAFKVERKMISAAVARGLCDLNTAWIAQGDAA